MQPESPLFSFSTTSNMASAAEPVQTGKFNFPGPIASKRRRMRSGGNVSTVSNNVPKKLADVEDDEDDESDHKTTHTSKCKGATTIPIFLKKTYKMVDTCNPDIASWNEEGDMFIVRDPDIFATEVIPQYFDHNKFSSFARQLNFYGFRKMQSKPIRNSDFDAGTAKHVTFFNENFKRGRCDLLKNIQRSTRGGTSSTQDHQREMQNLRDEVTALEEKIEDITTKTEERMRRLELDMLARMEQMMVAMQQQQQTQLELQIAVAPSTASSSQSVQQSVPALPAQQQMMGQTASTSGQIWDAAALSFSRNTSTAMSVSSMQYQPIQPRQRSLPRQQQQQQHQMPQQQQQMQLPQQQQQQRASSHNSTMPAPPTLPPHPKQKQLDMSNFPGAGNVPPGRLNSLLSSRGLSGLARGTSVESTSSAVLLRNSWEDKFFSMLMLGENENNAAAGTPLGGGTAMAMANMMAQTSMSSNNRAAPVTVSNRSIEIDQGQLDDSERDHDLSSVSSSDIP